MMKRTNKNFKRLSVKQIKTYAAILLMSALSFEAIASYTEENMNPGTEMSASIESNIDTELSLESWMLLPFDSGVMDETALTTQLAPPAEAGYDEEMVLESWMTVPFQTDMIEEAGVEISTCAPAP